MSLKLNLEVEQGTTFNQSVDLINTDGSLFDVTGWTGTGQIRKHPDSNAAITMNVALTNGSLQLYMSSNTTEQLESGYYVYDVKITDGDGTVRRPLSGMVTVMAEVTKL